MAEAMTERLRAWTLEGESEHLRKHSAFALGLIRDPAAILLLRTMVKERDSYVSKTSRKFNSARGYTAIYLLGKLKDSGIVDDLLDIMRQPGLFQDIEILEEFIEQPDLVLTITLKSSSNLRYDMKDKIRGLITEKKKIWLGKTVR